MTGPLNRSTSAPSAAKAQRRMGPIRQKTSSTVNSTIKTLTNAGARKL